MLCDYDKLKEKDRVNNYLVSGGMFSHPVYSQGQERIYINKCFDNLIYAIKEHLSIKSFEPFTDKRADEYIDLTEKGKCEQRCDSWQGAQTETCQNKG